MNWILNTHCELFIGTIPSNNLKISGTDCFFPRNSRKFLKKFLKKSQSLLRVFCYSIHTCVDKKIVKVRRRLLFISFESNSVTWYAHFEIRLFISIYIMLTGMHSVIIGSARLLSSTRNQFFKTSRNIENWTAMKYFDWENAVDTFQPDNLLAWRNFVIQFSFPAFSTYKRALGKGSSITLLW